ncbi:MAG TPA: DUF1553 domain-containing protein, partial [Planctomycetaceae bacterium]|nr:DUF1553 domain-containing protein [Planctomycetaceae bacterium]
QIGKDEESMRQARQDELDEVVETVGAAFLGLTVGCARCHDHKFDPIPQADYYRFLSTFTTTVRSNIELDLNPGETRRRQSEWEREHKPLAEALAAFERDQLPRRFVKWLDEAEQLEGAWRKTIDWVVLQPEKIESAGGATFKPLDDGSFLVEGNNPDHDTFTITGRFSHRIVRALRVEALSDPSLPQGGPGRAANGNFGLSEVSVSVLPPAPTPCTPENRDAPPRPVPLVNPRATFEQNDGNLAVAAAIDGNPQTGWAVDPQFGKDHAAVFEIRKADADSWSEPWIIRLQFAVNKQHAIGRLRVSVSLRESPPLDGRTLPQKVAMALDQIEGHGSAQILEPAEHQTLLDWYKRQDSEWVQLNEPLQQSLTNKPQPTLTQVMVASEGFTPIRHHTQGADFFERTHFLKRGDCDQKDGVADPGFLQVAMRHPEGTGRWREEPPEGWRTSYRRRSLANWITDTQHGPGHLLARVIVNRLWHHHFGRGLIATPNDFGTQGERPSHPELLDWLAVKLIESGWRLKPIHKLIMTSAAYRQSAEFDAAKSKADPLNTLVWRYAPRRLEAEIIRDAMLAASGTLDPAMYGPGTLDEGHTRRSIYFMIKRSKLVPMLVIFDTPEPLVSVGQRPATTIAPQALLFLNNEHVRAWTKRFAARLAPAAERSLEDAVTEGYRIAVARRPTEGELHETVAFLERQQASYASAGQTDARELALADFCQVLVSLNEFIYVD